MKITIRAPREKDPRIIYTTTAGAMPRKYLSICADDIWLCYAEGLLGAIQATKQFGLADVHIDDSCKNYLESEGG